jgi:hypothetical protein
MTQPVSGPFPSPTARVTLAPYKSGRFWAVWINDELLVVTVYRKGARAVLERLGLKDLAVEVKRPKLEGRWK